MADSPLRGSNNPVNSIRIPYGLAGPPTSTSDRRTRRILSGLWLALFAAELVYVCRYALSTPFVDEWLFMPVVLGEEPVGPWLWALHNEHRFPLPRVVYIGLFRLTGTLWVGCLVSLVGISLVAAGLMRLARRVRGRASLADAVFPLLLMHVGQGENLYMGYQLAFMLTAALAAGLLSVMVTRAPEVRPDEVFRSGLLAAVLGWFLLACGAAGLAFGVAAAGWVLFLALFGRLHRWQRVVLGATTLVTPAYLALYMQGYHRPSHHPASAGVFESIRVGLQAQAMALGPAATGLWPAIGVAIVVIALVVVVQLGRWFFRSRMDSRAVGLLLFVGAAGAVAFGIGWGRSGFLDEMGFAWRYGWITAPAVWAAFFTWLLVGGRVSTYGHALLAAPALALFPFNEGSGFRDAELEVRPAEDAWAADVRRGPSVDELVNQYFPGYPPDWQARIARALRSMRDHRYGYYESLGGDPP